jgi:hypothetical protein
LTLVAAVQIDQTPVLIGDLLITGLVGQGERELREYPSPKEVDQFLPRGIEAKKLRRKLVRLSDRLVVGFSGNPGTFTTVFGRLRQKLERFEGSREQLKRLFRQAPEPQSYEEPCEIVGWYALPDQMTAFRWNSHDGDLEDVAPPYVSGSARPRVEARLQNEDLFGIAPSYLKGTGQAIFASLGVCGNLLSGQFAPDGGLQNRFGVGYELMYFDGRRFVELSNVAHLFGEIEFDSSMNFSLDFGDNMYFYYYKDGVLRLSFVSPGESRVETYAIPGVSDSQTSERLQRPMTSIPQWHCYSILCKVRFEGVEHSRIVSIPAPADGSLSLPFDIRATPRGLEVEFKPDSEFEFSLACMTGMHALAAFDRLREIAISRYENEPELSLHQPGLIDVLQYTGHGAAYTLAIQNPVFGSDVYEKFRSRAATAYETLLRIAPRHLCAREWQVQLSIVRQWKRRPPGPGDLDILNRKALHRLRGRGRD